MYYILMANVFAMLVTLLIILMVIRCDGFETPSEFTAEDWRSIIIVSVVYLIGWTLLTRWVFWPWFIKERSFK